MPKTAYLAFVVTQIGEDFVLDEPVYAILKVTEEVVDALKGLNRAFNYFKADLDRQKFEGLNCLSFRSNLLGEVAFLHAGAVNAIRELKGLGDEESKWLVATPKLEAELKDEEIAASGYHYVTTKVMDDRVYLQLSSRKHDSKFETCTILVSDFLDLQNQLTKEA